MGTKLKGWTARRPVKICLAILIPILMFISLYGAVGFEKLENKNNNLLFTNLDNNDYFYDNYAENAQYYARNVFELRSEEHIRNMGCLEWRLRERYEITVSASSEQDQNDTTYSDDYPVTKPDGDGDTVWYESYDLVSTNNLNQWYFGEPVEDVDSPRARQIVKGAINQQLSELYYAKGWLEEANGLYYYITDGERYIGNVSTDAGAEFFRSQSVYLIIEPGRAEEHSRTRGSPYAARFYYNSGSQTSYIAFSSEAVNAQNSIWRVAQSRLEKQLVMIIIPLVVILVLIIILLTGAGRKYGVGAGQIHLLTIDKPWLDISLCLLACYESSVCYAVYEGVRAAWRYDNTRWIYALCAALSVLTAPPLIWWLTSFTKHCKAGKWWRYTLIYALIRGFFSKLRRFVKSLWSGFPLTLKAILLGCLLLAVSLIFIAIDPSEVALIFALILAALTMYGLLRYTRKLYLLEQGAKGASGGKYDTIAVTGGELGRIAASINNISDGINTAVTERMKSERLKTELITNISHDIRTPITSLITYTDLLKSEGFGSARAPDYLDILIQKTARLKTLTDDLFEASKAASGNIEVHVSNLDLADLVRQVLGELDERVRGSGLDFRLNIPEHAPVRADGKLLWRVMENLLSNVFKYAAPGSRVYIDTAPEAEWYRLDVKNISERPLNVEPSELLERFKRGDEARSGEGSGLGLSIAQSFVQSQGGRFELSIDGDLFKASVYLAKA